MSVFVTANLARDDKFYAVAARAKEIKMVPRLPFSVFPLPLSGPANTVIIIVYTCRHELDSDTDTLL